MKIKRKELPEFVSEYGTADSLPELDSLRRFIAEQDLWPVNWKVFTRRGLHSDRLRKWTGEPASLEQMIAASQDYQPFVLKYHTEFSAATSSPPATDPCSSSSATAGRR